MAVFNRGKFVVAVQIPFNAEAGFSTGETQQIQKGDYLVADGMQTYIMKADAFNSEYSEVGENRYKQIRWEDPEISQAYKNIFGKYATVNDVSMFDWIAEGKGFKSIEEIPADELPEIISEAKMRIERGF